MVSAACYVLFEQFSISLFAGPALGLLPIVACLVSQFDFDRPGKQELREFRGPGADLENDEHHNDQQRGEARG